MEFRVLLKPEARFDIQNGIEYYKSISIPLGKKFLFQVKDSLNELRIILTIKSGTMMYE